MLAFAMFDGRRLGAVLGLVAALAVTGVGSRASAESDIGFHFGLNFDVDLAIGFESRFGVARIGQSVDFQINPTFTIYSDPEFGNWMNFSFNTPFEFEIQNSVVRPFAAPGLSIWRFSRGSYDRTRGALNLIGGVLFDLGTTEPFVQLKVTVGGVDTAELLGGIIFTL